MNRLRKPWLILLVLILLAWPLAACARQDEPARVTEKFLRAAASNDLATLQETVDPDVADEVLGVILFQIGLQALVGGGSSEFVELKVQTIRNDGQRATVRASGKGPHQSLGHSVGDPFRRGSAIGQERRTVVCDGRAVGLGSIALDTGVRRGYRLV